MRSRRLTRKSVEVPVIVSAACILRRVRAMGLYRMRYGMFSALTLLILACPACSVSTCLKEDDVAILAWRNVVMQPCNHDVHGEFGQRLVALESALASLERTHGQVLRVWSPPDSRALAVACRIREPGVDDRWHMRLWPDWREVDSSIDLPDASSVQVMTDSIIAYQMNDRSPPTYLATIDGRSVNALASMKCRAIDATGGKIALLLDDRVEVLTFENPRAPITHSIRLPAHASWGHVFFTESTDRVVIVSRSGDFAVAGLSDGSSPAEIEWSNHHFGMQGLFGPTPQRLNASKLLVQNFESGRWEVLSLDDEHLLERSVLPVSIPVGQRVKVMHGRCDYVVSHEYQGQNPLGGVNRLWLWRICEEAGVQDRRLRIPRPAAAPKHFAPGLWGVTMLGN
jgi:hypothetical protein